MVILNRSIFVGALMMSAGAILFGQSIDQKSAGTKGDPALQQVGDSQDVLRVISRMVQVFVIAQDTHGRAIADLSKEDFTVLDQGKPQKISSFTPLMAGPGILDTSSTTPTRDFSNLAESEQGAAPSVNVILLDFVNTSLKDFSYAQMQVLKFARQTRPEDQIAIYLLTPSGLDVLHDFTNDADSLARVMSGPKHSPNSSASIANDDASAVAANAAYKRMNNAIDDAFAESFRFYAKYVNRPQVTAWAMQRIAKRLAGIPGRKNLIWVAGTFPVNAGYMRTSAGPGVSTGGDFTPALSSTAKVLNDANVYVYPVETRGPSGEEVLPVVDPPPYQGHAQAAPQINGVAPNEKMFQAMNISEAIRAAIDDSRESYAIGYYPDHNKWDGSFREIKVKVNRPGITLRYRAGYFASPEGTEVVAQKRLPLIDALQSPVPITGLRLEVHAEPVDAAAGREMKVGVRINAEQMHFEQKDDRWEASVEVVWAALSSDGRIVARGENSFGVKPDRSGYDEILRDGLAFSEHASVPSEAVELRLVVRDLSFGATGSVNIPLSAVFESHELLVPAKK
jgi:VWFA-related protein